MKRHAPALLVRARSGKPDAPEKIVESASSPNVSIRSTTGDSRVRSFGLRKASTTRHTPALRMLRLLAHSPQKPVSGATSPTQGLVPGQANTRAKSRRKRWTEAQEQRGRKAAQEGTRLQRRRNE